MNRVRRGLAATLLMLGAGQGFAQPPVVISSAPDRVAVTLYRDPERGDGPIDRDSPSAFALISETRTVTLPAGAATIRFEGVAGGIVPQSAILFGAEAAERNRDAALLSRSGLVDAYTGQRVTLRRTDPATGATVEERATIRSRGDRLVVSTPRGIEALYCSGLVQTLLYPGLPPGLSDRPVLSMTTKDQPGGRLTVTLAYLATGFDWDATYVGTLGADRRSLNLFAWLTMASADETSFPDARTAAVAGRIARSEDTRGDGEFDLARFSDGRDSACWPAGRTSDIAVHAPLPPPAPPAAMQFDLAEASIVVTASRRQTVEMSSPIGVTALAEPLGDLKLYRIPVPVTVAARSQKQVAFLADKRVSGSLVYRARARWDFVEDPEQLFRFRNTRQAGLGVPLPAGKVILYQHSPFGRQLVGETSVADKTTEEEVELVLGPAQNVTIETDEVALERGVRQDLIVRNANPFPVVFELAFENDPDIVVRPPPGKLVTRPGRRAWTTTLAPASERRISYSAWPRGDD